MKNLLIFLLCFCLQYVSAQEKILEESWNTIFESKRLTSVPEKGEDFVIDSDGNVIVIATGIILRHNADMIVIKYDISGNELWRKNIHIAPYDDIGKNIGVDKWNNIYISGTARYQSPAKYVVVKISPIGEIIWEKIHNRESNEYEPFDMVVDSLGNCYMTGSFYTSNVNFGELLIFKYNTDGELEWEYIFEAPEPDENYHYGEQITQNNFGDVFVVGKKFEADASYIFLIKLSSSGSLDTMITSIENYAYISKLRVDADNNIYLLCHHNYTVYTIKYDSDLNVIWSNTITDQIIRGTGDLYVDNNQNCYIANTVDWEDSGSHSLLIKYDKNGSFKWSTYFYGKNGLTTRVESLCGDNKGGLYILASDEKNETYWSANDFVVVGYDTNGTKTWDYYYENYEWGESIAEIIKYNAVANNVLFLSSSIGMESGTGLDILLTCLSSMGEELWSARAPGEITSNDVPINVQIDNDLNTYSLIESDASNFSRAPDKMYFLCKYDIYGNVLLTKNINEIVANLAEVKVMILDSDNSVYLAGSVAGDSSGSDCFTLKLNPEGVILWKSQVSFSTGIDNADFISIDSLGNIIVYGSSEIDSHLKYPSIVKFSVTGDMEWSMQLDHSMANDGIPKGIAIDAENDIYILAFKTGSSYLAKIDQNGSLIWEIESSNVLSNASAIEIDRESNIYIGGSNYRNWIIEKLDSSGTELWSNENPNLDDIETAIAKAICIDSENNIYVTGPNPYPYGSGGSYSDLIKYDQNGNEKWSRRIKGSRNPALKCDTNDNVYVYNEYGHLCKFNSSGILLWEYDDLYQTDIERYAPTFFDMLDDGSYSSMLIYEDWRDGVNYLGGVLSSIVKTVFFEQIYPELPPNFVTKIFQNNIAEKYADIVVVADTLLSAPPSVQVKYDTMITNIDMQNQVQKNIFLGHYIFNESGIYTITTEAEGLNGISKSDSRVFSATYVEAGEDTTLYTMDSTANVQLMSNSLDQNQLFFSYSNRWEDESTYVFTPSVSLSEPARISIHYTKEMKDFKIFRKSGDSWKELITSVNTMDSTVYAYIDQLGEFKISESTRNEHAAIPNRFHLKQNYPNPFNSTTVIEYTVPVSSNIKLTIYDILGREIKTLVDSYQQAGNFRLKWDSKDNRANKVPSGIYILRFKSDSYDNTKRMLLIK